MPKRQVQIQHGEIVRRFAARLRELRLSRGMTQAELARQVKITAAYVGRLEAAGATPGIDLVERLAVALGTTVADLLPSSSPPETLPLLRDQASKLFESLLKWADRETLLMICPLLARLAESPTRRR